MRELFEDMADPSAEGIEEGGDETGGGEEQLGNSGGIGSGE